MPEKAHSSEKLIISPRDFRTGVLIGGALYVLFGLVDYFMMPFHFREIWILRGCIFIFGVLGLIVISYNKRIMKYARLMLMLLAFFGQLGINYMILISDPAEGSYLGYYAGLVIIILWSGFIFRLRFFEALFIFLSTWLCYNIVAVAFQGMLSEGIRSVKFAWFVGNNFFLFSSGMVSVVGTYLLERYQNNLEEESQKHMKAREKAEQSDSLKTAFLANMSHEIRTPMNTILGFSELLQKSDLDDEKRRNFAKIVASSGEQLMRIIDDIIDISKIESNHLQLKKQYINLNYILEEFIITQEQQKKSLNKPDLKLILKIPEINSVKHLLTDPVRLIQILSNLLSNAIKYTEAGYVETGYKVISVFDKQYLDFYVKDTGIGIAQDKFGLIFERFGQIQSDTPVSGTGLGLSISKGLVSLLGGEIWVESEINKGSIFHFTHPYTPAPDSVSNFIEE